MGASDLGPPTKPEPMGKGALMPDGRAREHRQKNRL